MITKTNKTKLKRLSKGQRTHVRRMKQAVRKDGTIYNSPKAHRTPVKIAEE